MLKLNHFQPQQLSSLIERVTIGRTNSCEFNLMFIPTHYVTLFIPLNGTEFYYNGIKYSKPTLKQILLKPALLRIPAHSILFGIRFYPYGTYPFSELTADDAFYQSATDDSSIVEYIINSLLSKYDEQKDRQTALLKDFYNYLLQNTENSSVNNFCDLQCLSYMSVYRTFKRFLNISPKKFERLIKFRLSVDHMIWRKQKLTDTGFDSGYYDQAHFTKEFKFFVGMTPSEYIKYLSKNKLYNFDSFTNFASLKV